MITMYLLLLLLCNGMQIHLQAIISNKEYDIITTAAKNNKHSCIRTLCYKNEVYQPRCMKRLYDKVAWSKTSREVKVEVTELTPRPTEVSHCSSSLVQNQP